MGTTRKRRTTEQLISDLEAKIAAVKAREVRKQTKADPFLRYASAAGDPSTSGCST
jgi:hypothetical protein